MTTPVAEVRSFAVTIPANTPVSAPVTQAITMPPRDVAWVHWSVPPGPAGLMGWRLSMSGGNAVIPTGGGFIITDDDSDTWNVFNQPDGGAWEVNGYNTDIYPHTVYLDFGLNVIGAGVVPSPSIPNAALSSTTAAPVTTPVTTPPALTVPPVSVPPVSVPPVTVPPVSTPGPLPAVQLVTVPFTGPVASGPPRTVPPPPAGPNSGG